MFNTVLINASKRLNSIPIILGINADKFGINANDIALNKLMSKCPVYFKTNSTTDVKIERTKNDFKIKFFMALYFFNYYIVNICLRVLEA